MIENIKKIYKNRRANPIGEYKKNAVIIFLLQEKEETYIIFEIRSFKLRSQGGDVSLPGGKIERGEMPLEAAIRESREELNIEDKDMEIISEMDYLVTPYNKIIYPFIARLKTSKITPSENEVDHIFKVPIEFFINNKPKCYKVKIKQCFPEDFPYDLIVFGEKYKFGIGEINKYFYKYNKYVIWGITASIIRSFINTIKDKNKF